MEVRFSFLPPEFKLRWVTNLMILAIAAFLFVFMTFIPLARPESSAPQWLWLLGGCLVIVYLCGTWVFPMRAVQVAAARNEELAGGRTVLVSAVAMSNVLGPEGLILRSQKKPEKGWFSIQESVVEVRSATGTVRVLIPGEIVKVAKVNVLNKHFFEPQVAISLIDGFVIQAIPVRPGMASIFPYGRKRLDAFLLDLEQFRVSGI